MSDRARSSSRLMERPERAFRASRRLHAIDDSAARRQRCVCQSSRCRASTPAPDADTSMPATTFIGPRFFGTLGIPLIAGREFTRADSSRRSLSPIVNEAFARKFNLRGDRRRRHADGARDETTSRSSTSRSSASSRTAKYSEIERRDSAARVLPAVPAARRYQIDQLLRSFVA